MHSILSFLDGRMAIPKVFGWFHILCLIVIALLCVFVVLKCRNISDKALNIILIVVSIALILFELYKQINMSYDVMAKNGVIHGIYSHSNSVQHLCILCCWLEY